MFNWNTNTTRLKTKKDDYAIWHLNQLINFGLNGAKINAKSLKKHWPRLKLDPKRRRFLKLLMS